MAQLVLITPVSLAGAGLTPTPTGGAEVPAAAPFLANVTVLQVGGPPERPHPRPPVPGGGGPVDPGWGVEVPVDPGWGYRPPVDPGYGRPEGPGWTPGLRPSHPIVLPPELGRPEHPIVLPPQPPVGGPPPEGTVPIWVFVPGHGAVGPIYVPKPGTPGKPEPEPK